MKAKYFKILAAVLAISVLAAIAVSQTVRRAHMHGDGMFGGPMLGHLARKLDLSDAQRAQVKDILAKEKPVIRPLMLQMAQSRSQLRQLALSGNFDEAKARELATQQAQTVTELTVQRARIESELFQVLTADQKTKLNDLIKQHEQRFLNHMQGPAEGEAENQ